MYQVKDSNLKFLRSLPKEWKPMTVSLRNSQDYKDFTLERLYGILKTYELEMEQDELLEKGKRKGGSVALVADSEKVEARNEGKTTTRKTVTACPANANAIWPNVLKTLKIESAQTLDIITVNQTFRDGQRIIESAGGVFTLGFFGFGSSDKRYLGIWYTKIVKRTVVWVANRETPVLDTSGVLRLDANGSLALSDGTNKVVIVGPQENVNIFQVYNTLKGP
ncbi:hypothetical protein AgCh_025598 [Apium graveolens]